MLLRGLCTRHNVDEAFHAMAKEPSDVLSKMGRERERESLMGFDSSSFGIRLFVLLGITLCDVKTMSPRVE